ncbi:MAG: hypothetical protein IKY93_04090 [Alistipes sp.]|nr:hypothetical protein [Alistipes sp.]
MKRFFSLLLLVATLAVSCTQNQEVDIATKDSQLTFYVDFTDTRIEFTDKNTFRWEGNETLGTYIHSEANTLNVPASVICKDGKAMCHSMVRKYNAGDFLYVYHPWNILNDTKSAYDVTLTIPSKQKQVVAGDFVVENMPMVSAALTLNPEGEKPTVYMRPVAGFLRINVYSSGGVDEKVHSVSYTAYNEPISGDYSFDLTTVDNSVDFALYSNSECKKNVTVSVATPYTITSSVDTTKSIYMVLAPSETKGDIKITTDKAIYTYEAHYVNVARNKYYDLNIDLSRAVNRKAISSQWGGGSGTINDPYLVDSAEDLVSLATLCNSTDTNAAYANKVYQQICDIDMSGISFTPIGNTDPHAFMGTYDGGGFTISGLNVTPSAATEASALFGYAVQANICNLTIKDMTNHSTAEKSAGFIGVSYGSTVTDCALEGQLNLYNIYSGGIIGWMDSGRVANCKVTGRVENNVAGITWNGQTNSAITGGFVGYALNDAVIENCTLSGDVAVMGRYAAGIVARLEDSTVRGCTIRNASEISSISHYCGGIVAMMVGNTSLISDCRFEGRVNSGYTITGGIVGSINAGKVYNCIATSTSSVADDANNVGGIAGEIATTTATDIALIDNCASYGTTEGAHSVAGIVGHISHSADGAYAGVTNCATIGGKIISKGAYNKNYNLAGGVAGWITKGYGTTVVANCAGRAGEIHGAPISELTATKELISGLVACVDNKKGTTTLYGSYTDATSANMYVGFENLNNNSGRYGALFGYSYYNVTLTSCFHNESIAIHGNVGDGYTCHESGCAGYSKKQMTDGTLLAQLNAAAQAYQPRTGTPEAKSWVSDGDGYPIPAGLPKDTTPASAEPKKVSVIGDSISTFRGYIPYKYSTYYPRADGTFISVEDMYWYQLIYKHMTNARLERNIAYSGSWVTKADTSKDTYFAKRFIDQNGVGDADIVIIHGGTNDWNKNAVNLVSGLGVRATSGPTDAQLQPLFAAADAAKTRAEIEALNDTTFCEAYIKLIKLILERNPETKIVCLIGDYLGVGVQQATHKMAAHFPVNCKCVDLRAVNGFNDQTYMPKLYYSATNTGQCHPNQQAMAFIAEKIYSELGIWLED